MIRRNANGGRPGLLVSVRNAAEAIEALAGGADVIDVKEPSRGPLGAADAETIADVVRAVADRVPVTVAAGELLDLQMDALLGLAGVTLFKIGLAGCAARGDWRKLWTHAISLPSGEARPAAVVYADWRAADAIDPQAVLNAAVELGCPALLVDTWDKSAGTLMDHWSSDDLRMFIQQVRQRGLIAALAGSLSPIDVREAADLGPDLVAVRGAACEGGREGKVSRRRVSALREQLVADAANPLTI